MAISLVLLGGVAGPALAQNTTPARLSLEISQEMPIAAPVEIKPPANGPAVTMDPGAGQPTRIVPAKGNIIRTAAQLGNRGKTGEDDIPFIIQIDLPGPDRLFRRDSEAKVRERIRLDSRTPGAATRVTFPIDPPLTRDPYVTRSFERMTTWAEPGYVLHCRLFFEQPNFERQGWDLGILTPFANLGQFYYDTIMFPYHYWSRPCDCCDSNVGKCLPGDPTPLYFYWEEFSWTGLAGQAAVVTGAIFIFP